MATHVRGRHPGRARTRDAIAAANAALDLIDELEDQMTVYRDHSEVSRLNATAAERRLPWSNQLFDLFTRCAVWTRETEGAFDIATGALVKAWGFLPPRGPGADRRGNATTAMAQHRLPARRSESRTRRR